MSDRRDTDALNLMALLGDQPHGISVPAIRAHMGWPTWRTRHAILRVREVCGKTDTINLVCEPNGANQPWLYRLVGTIEEAGPWVGVRLADVESRMTAIHHITASLVRGSDGRSLNGKKARLLERTIRHLIEDLDALNA